jgi:N-acetylmuramoyl-L-alanine amidase
VRNERGTDKSVAALPLIPHFFLWAASLGIVLALLTSADITFATTIEQFSLRRIDRAVEVAFAMRGVTPRWRLHSHGQELWLDLEHSRVTASVEHSPKSVFFPLARVSMRDLGGERARLVIRVRGQVDYVVAQMPRQLVVRIAPSSQAVDLGFKEFPDEEGTEMPMGAESAIAGAGPALSPNPSPGLPLVSRGEPTYGHQTEAQAVQPVARDVAASPWLGQDRARPMVAIDAGHGGFDPGTESAAGIAEKTVALAIARRLAAALEARGVGAELTRNDDNFLSLAERTALANHAHADLFVSIHLNSSTDRNTSGIETYYLNNTTDRATIRLAQIENGSDYGALGQSNLNYILTNLRQDYKAHESSSLARMIEAEAVASIAITMGIRVNPMGAKMGPFFVLVGAEMPSVLIECGFLSNPREAQFLIQPRYQQALADGIALAIMHYFNVDAAVGNL